MTLKHDFKRFDELALPTDDHNLALFRVHFLVMNALYDIKNDLQDGFELYISPLAIFLKQNGEPVLSGGKQALQEQDDNQANADTLSEYYLKWDNLTQADSAEIDKLLSGFWQRYLAFDRKTEALKMLNLPLGANWPLVKKTYRSLANKHHPDKGGSAQRFIEMREAYEILRACLLN